MRRSSRRSPASRASTGACSTSARCWSARGAITIIDDYGHHPTEIAATLDALRQAFAGRRLVLVFQPHRYTRTRDLLDDFARVLSTADALLVTEVYAAGEAPIEGADARAICRAVRSARQGRADVRASASRRSPRRCADVLRDGDVVVTMGAGTSARSRTSCRRGSLRRQRAAARRRR